MESSPDFARALVREDVVNQLVDAAFDAMQLTARAQDANVPEVGSAGLTMALRTIRVLKHLGGDVATIRAAVERLLLECDDRTVN